MLSIKKTAYPLLQKGVNRTRKNATSETKMLVIGKMEAGEKCANVYSSLGLALVTVSTVMANTEKIKQLAQKTTKLPKSNVSYTRNFNVENMELLLTLCVDDLNQKRIPFNMLFLKRLGLFLMKFNEKKVETRHSVRAKRWFCKVQATLAYSLLKN
jgi:hypothetical protein